MYTNKYLFKTCFIVTNINKIKESSWSYLIIKPLFFHKTKVVCVCIEQIMKVQSRVYTETMHQSL